jgi:hypothetical protein
MTDTVQREENVGMYQAVCDAIFVVESSDTVAIVFDADKIHRWYQDRIGMPITLAVWPDIEAVLIYRVKEIKTYLSRKQKKLIIRLIHETNATWLTLKIHKTLDPHCEIFQYVAAGVIDI